jgi:hypothetical protein
MPTDASVTDRVQVGPDRSAGLAGCVQFTLDGNRLIVGVNPNGLPMNWHLAVVTREHATVLRDWLNRQLPEPNDIEATGGCCCNGCISEGMCDLYDPADADERAENAAERIGEMTPEERDSYGDL